METIPAVRNNPSSFNKMFLDHSHICNGDFETNPKCCLAFRQDSEGSQLIHAVVLYVGKAYRNDGYGRYLINGLFLNVSERCILQADVEINRLIPLAGFYRKLGFITTGIPSKKDEYGIRYVSFFTSKSRIRLELQADGETKVVFC